MFQFSDSQILFNEWEEKRINNLKRCRRERDRIIMEKQITKSKRSKEADKKRNSNSNQSKYLMQSSCVNENNPIKGSRFCSSFEIKPFLLV